ncbi:MAG: epimerase [Bacteroidetes bacterium]|nr:epimerase [Bacteroidota bacterium]
MNNVLVLGGTGAMGSFLVEILAQKGYNVYVTTRSNRKSFDNIYYCQGNAHDINFVKYILSDKYWFAIIDFMQYTTNEFQNRYQLFLKSTLQYIFVSSARVYADSIEPINEMSPRLLDISNDNNFLYTDDYALAKARQEDLLLKNDLKNWTIIRPYMTYFDNRLDLGYFSKELWLFRVVNNKSILFLDDVASKLTTLTYGSDVANSIYCLLGEKNAFGEIFNIMQC